jgi:chromosome segregation ATPase
MSHLWTAFTKWLTGGGWAAFILAALGYLIAFVAWIDRLRKGADTRIDARYEELAKELRAERESYRAENKDLRETVNSLQTQVSKLWERIDTLQQDKAMADNLVIACEAEKAVIQRAFDESKRKRDAQIKHLEEQVTSMQAWIDERGASDTSTSSVHIEATMDTTEPKPTRRGRSATSGTRRTS